MRQPLQHTTHYHSMVVMSHGTVAAQTRSMPCAEVSRDCAPGQHTYVIWELLVQFEAVVHLILLRHSRFPCPAA